MTLLKNIDYYSARKAPQQESKVILFLPERYNDSKSYLDRRSLSMNYNPETKKRLKKIQETLNEKDKVEFNNDIIDAVFDYFSTGSDEQLKNIIESWDATAEILLDEDAANRIKRAEDDFENGEYELWDPDTM